MEWSIAPVCDSTGEITQLLAVQNDITENVKMETRLEKARQRELKRIKEIEEANTKLHSLTEKQKKHRLYFKRFKPPITSSAAAPLK